MIKFSITEFAIIPTELILPTFVVSVFSISLSNHGLGVYPLAISLFLLLLKGHTFQHHGLGILKYIQHLIFEMVYQWK